MINRSYLGLYQIATPSFTDVKLNCFFLNDYNFATFTNFCSLLSLLNACPRFQYKKQFMLLTVFHKKSTKLFVVVAAMMIAVIQPALSQGVTNTVKDSLKMI